MITISQTEDELLAVDLLRPYLYERIGFKDPQDEELFIELRPCGQIAEITFQKGTSYLTWSRSDPSCLPIVAAIEEMLQAALRVRAGDGYVAQNWFKDAVWLLDEVLAS